MGDTEAPRCHSHLQVMTPPEHRGHPGLGLGLSLPAPLPLTLRLRILGIVLSCRLRLRRRSPARNRELRQQLRWEALRLERSADDLALLRRSLLLVSPRPAVSGGAVCECASYLGEARGRHAPGFLCDLLFLAPLLRRSIAARLQAHLLRPLVVAALAGHCAVVGGRRGEDGPRCLGTLLSAVHLSPARDRYS